MKKQDVTAPYGRVASVREVGWLHRQERRRQGLTLEDVYGVTDLSTRFLSEFERGKEHASVGRVLRALQSLGLDVLVLPRAQAERALRLLARDGQGTAEPRR